MSVRHVVLLLSITQFAYTAQPTIADAASRMQAGDFTGAAQILETITKNEPANGRAWRNLGLAYDRMKKFEPAIAAYRKALEIQPAMPAPMLSIGLDYAELHDAGQAFEWLAKAKATHRIDMTQLDGAPAAAMLKTDARYAAVLPTRADFDNPFVEPVKIIREWDGEAANDQFGWIARVIGDVDGDGTPDFVTSAPTKNIGGANAGRVYVYSTKSGKLLWSVDGHPGDQLGSGIEAAGDANHDGIPDVVASSPGAGKAYIYSGKDGRLLVTISGEAPTDRFGQHVAGSGDVNHDGYDDVIVGAPGNNKATGAAYVYSGRDGKLLQKWTGENPGDGFGAAVAGFTSKGPAEKSVTLLMVGAQGGGEKRFGRVYVYGALTEKPKFTIDANEDSGQALGAMFLSIPGDMDGDGFPDVFASDWQDRPSGRIYAHSGKDGHRLFTLAGETPGEGFGTSSSTAGDVDGDGRADLIVGSWQYSGEAGGAGRAYLYSGANGSLMKKYTCRIPGDAFGFDAVGIGDVDGDGTVDLLMTSAWSGVHGFHSGRMFVMSSGVKRVRTR